MLSIAGLKSNSINVGWSEKCLDGSFSENEAHILQTMSLNLTPCDAIS
jgi:hypothetical protein